MNRRLLGAMALACALLAPAVAMAQGPNVTAPSGTSVPSQAVVYGAKDQPATFVTPQTPLPVLEPLSEPRDGAGNTLRTIPTQVGEGTPIEWPGAPWTLGAANAVTAPLSMQNVSSITWKVTVPVSFVGTITPRANNALANSGLPDNSTWDPIQCVNQATGAAVTSITAAGVFTCSSSAVGSAPEDLAVTAYTSGSASVTAIKNGASPALGLPPVASWPSWKATTINNDYAGAVVDKTKMSLAYSSYASDAAITYNGASVYNGTGPCSIGTYGTSSSDTVATWHAYFGSLDYNPGSALWSSIYSCQTVTNKAGQPAQAAAIKKMYDTANSRWTGVILDLMDGYFQSTIGYAPPDGYGFYYEIEESLPSVATATSLGFQPWIAPAWMFGCAATLINSDNMLSMANCQQSGGWETDFHELSVSNAYSGGPQLYANDMFHVHQSGQNAQGGVATAGYLTAARSIAGDVQYWGGDSNPHLWGGLAEKNTQCATFDTVVGQCFLKPDLQSSLTRYNIEWSMNPADLVAPTGSTSNTLTYYIFGIRVWLFPLNSSPVPGLSENLVHGLPRPANDNGETWPTLAAVAAAAPFRAAA